MFKNLKISRWVYGLLLCGAVSGLMLENVALGQGGRGPGGGGPGGRRGGPGGNSLRGGPQGGQQGGGFGGGPIAGGGGGQGNCQSMVDKVMSMDSNGDGTLTANEVQDPRLQGMMSVADVDADGVVTQDELRNMFTQQMAQQGEFRGGPGGPPHSGELMPSFIQDELELTEEQRSRLAELQKAVDKKIQGILTKEQRARYKEMQMRGPGGPGGGPGGPGGGGRGPGGPAP